MTYQHAKEMLAAIYADEEAIQRGHMDDWETAYQHALSTWTLPELIYHARGLSGFRRLQATGE